MADHIRLENHDLKGLLGWMEKFDFTAAIYCNVGKMNPDLPLAVGQYCKTLIRLDNQTSLPFRVMYRSKESLGYDRIAAAAGAMDRFPGMNVAIFDFGTAITIDFITENREYLGGNISPGLSTRFRSLHDHTAGLPLVKKDRGFPSFGIDTRSAIAAGVQRGIVHEITGYIHDFKERYSHCELIATGGDAAFFKPFLTHPLIVDPLLVLRGLNAILEFNLK